MPHNLINYIIDAMSKKRQNDSPVCLLSYVGSHLIAKFVGSHLNPKLHDLVVTLKSNHVTCAFITETCLSDKIDDAAVEIFSSYSTNSSRI